MDFYSDDDDSDPEFDEGLQEDLDLVRRSCIIAGTDPDAAVAKVSSYLVVPAPAGVASAAVGGGGGGGGGGNGLWDVEEEEEEEDEDLALVRSIRENLYRSKASPSSPLPDHHPGSSPRPICVWPPSGTDDNDEEDDLETLRAIQRRFSHYHAGTSTGSLENMKHETPRGRGMELVAYQSGEEDLEKQNSKALTETGFPKAALSLVDALKKNRACQKFIRMKLINIEAKIEVNKDLRDRVKCLMDYQSCCKRSFGRILCQKEDPRVRLISSQKPRSQPAQSRYKMPALFLGPAHNPHVSNYEMVLKQFPMLLQKQSWSDTEKDKLAKGMKQQYQETLLVDSMNNGSSDAVGMAYALTNTGSNFEVTPEGLRSVLPLIKWDNIATMYLPGRSGAECESRWLNHDDPLINLNAWTAQEEKRLMLTVQEKGLHNWISIAVALGTHRTPFQCLARYQRSLNPHILKRVWTKDEDLQLLTAIETFGCNWQLVSASLDGRCGNQCSNRFRKTLLPERTRVGRWYPDEDKRLVVCVKLFGSGSWNKIAQFIPGRTQSQCNERWLNVLDPDIDLGEWRPEEDTKLLAAVCEVGRCWSKIAKVLIPHRTDNMCMRRWRKLCGDELPSVKAVNQVKRAIFQSNFVGRETERPAVGPSDFPSLVHSKVDRGDENTLSSDQVRTPRKRSRRSCEDNPPASDAQDSSACVTSAARVAAADAAVNSIMRRSKKKSSGSKGQPGNDLAVSDCVSNPSSGFSPARKRKCTSDNNGVVRKRMRGSISIDNEATLEIFGGSIGADNEEPTELMGGSTCVGIEGTVNKRKRKCTARKRKCTNDNNGVVRKRMRGSISIDNEATLEIFGGSIGADNEEPTELMGGSTCVGIEGTVNKRTTGTVLVGDEGAVKKKTRGSVSVGNGGAIKRRTGRSISVGDEGAVKKRTRGSISIDDQGHTTKRKRASRKSAEDNSTADGMVNAASELDLPSAPSEERDVDTGNVNKLRRKSIPRPKQINMTEENAEEYSTCTRLADCMSFARGNGANRNRRYINSSCIVRPSSNAMQSNGLSGGNLQVQANTISSGPDFISFENGSTAETSGGS